MGVINHILHPAATAFFFIMRLVWLLCCSALLAQEWHSYGGDAGGMKYSALKQINRANLAKLKVAWTFHTGDVSDGTALPTKSDFEATPLTVDGLLYLTTPFNRLIALDTDSDFA